MKMTLERDAPPLEINHQYTWFLQIQCNNTYLEPGTPQISSSITRVKGDVTSMNQEELISFYNNYQIWYDSLETAFELAQSGKNTYWEQLLNNIEMERFAFKLINS